MSRTSQFHEEWRFRHLPPEFNPEKKSQVREVLNLLLSLPTDTPWAARKWFELFCESSDWMANHQIQLEIELSCQPDHLPTRDRIKVYEEEILSLILSHRDALMRRYIESPFQTAMHDDDRGRIRKDFSSRLKHTDTKLTQLHLQENAIVRDYRAFVHKAQAPLFHKSTPLSVIVGKQSDRSEATRKFAFQSYWGFIAQNERIYTDFFERLAAIRNEQKNLVGAKSYEEFVYSDLGRLDFDPESCAKLRDGIKAHIVPVIVELAKKHSRSQENASSHEKIQPWNARIWQKHFPTALPSEGSPKRFMENLQAACNNFHSSLALCYKALSESESLDIFPRAGKGSGAFCALRPLSGVPFIFGNFSISTKDLFTLFHELGHAVHGFCSAPIRNSLLRSPGLEFCEFVSTTFEFLSHDVLSYFWDDPEQAEMAKRFHLYHSVTFLPFAAQMDEFQSRVYAQPQNACEIWSSLNNEYRPHIDWSEAPTAKRMGWCSRSHVYSSPFYYIDYAIAQIGAWQIYEKRKKSASISERNESLKDFFDALALGGQRSSHELFEAAGIHSPFEEDTLIRVARIIEENCSML